MKMNQRKWHRYVGVIIAAPLLFITITGIFLQFRSNLNWIQPKAAMVDFNPNHTLLTLNEITKNYDPKTVEQVIYKPSNGVLTIRLKDGLEIQKHPESGVILQESVRRTSLLIDLHQGSIKDSFFLRYFIFIPVGFGLFFLIISGMIIYARRR